MKREDIRKIRDYVWEIPQEYRSDMRVPGRFYASPEMLPEILGDEALEQVVNVATLPGITGYSLAMPDIHWGYGFCVGGVAATRLPEGVISPGGIGFDINCGVRLLLSRCSRGDVRAYAAKLTEEIYRTVPSGVGRSGDLRLSDTELNKVLEKGAGWAVEKGYGVAEDLRRLESGGCLSGADAHAVSKKAKDRGRSQLGTMGAGNHFIELDYVSDIYSAEAAQSFGLYQDQFAVLIHSGSRGLGHQVATDYIQIMLQAMPKYKIILPDRQLAAAPFHSPEGTRYFSAMQAAANFAWTNRQLLQEGVRASWKRVFGKDAGELQVLYDVAHNIAKCEWHIVQGKRQEVLVHRKGATRAFPAGHKELPEAYRAAGQPVLVPGTMGTSSYILVGQEQGMKETFGTTAHGAGRRMSRTKAKRAVRGSELKKKLEEEGISVMAGSMAGIAEEAPIAYKDVDCVADVVHKSGIAKKVARLKPLGVIKG